MRKLRYLIFSEPKELKWHKQLDKALQIFISTKDMLPNEKTLHSHEEFKNQGFDLTKAIIEKLKKDGYLDSRYAWEGPTPETFHSSDFVLYVTYEGLMLIEEGGYTAKVSNQKRIANQLFFLQLIIAFSTGIAAIYYGIEIYKAIYPIKP